ncbi:MAG TPA: hypothetical protein VII21_01690 [Aestuariivirga sp.]|jgi:hypothetical protein
MHTSKTDRRNTGAAQDWLSTSDLENHEFEVTLTGQLNSLWSARLLGGHKELDMFFVSLNKILAGNNATPASILKLVESVHPHSGI